MSSPIVTGVVLGVPHGSRGQPADLQPRLIGDFDHVRRREESDMYTREVYALPSARAIVCYPWSRFTCDPNREENDRTATGLIPRCDFYDRPVYPEWPVPDDERERRLRHYYRPYHRTIDVLVRAPGTTLYIDCHSMLRVGPTISPDQSRPRPEVCIGHFRHDTAWNPIGLTCRQELAEEACRSLSQLLRAHPPADDPRAVTGEVTLNVPFMAGNGTALHSTWLVERDGRLESVDPALPDNPGLQVELNQKLWVDPHTMRPMPGRIDWMRSVLDRWIVHLDGWLRAHPSPIPPAR